MPETGRELIPQSGGIVSPAVTPEQAIKRWEDYLELKKRLLVEDDYQAYQGGKKLPKKSGWRKLATAFNLTDELVGEMGIRRDAKERPVSVRCEVRVTAPNGRSAIGVHGAHVNERCCPAADGEPCPNKDREGHECCPVGCSGWRHWSHPDDVMATAHTRAKNRAISDLVGGGEISAEEMEDGKGSPSTPHVAPMGLCPVHKVPFVERTGPRGKFWACPERPGGQFCKERPQIVEGQKADNPQDPSPKPPVSEPKLETVPMPVITNWGDFFTWATKKRDQGGLGYVTRDAVAKALSFDTADALYKSQKALPECVAELLKLAKGE